jgi:hypothetical protein
MTLAMKERLRPRGFTEDDIYNMSPQRAREILAATDPTGRARLEPIPIRELARWFEEEGNRPRVGLKLDQNALDRDLRQRLAERRGSLRNVFRPRLCA